METKKNKLEMINKRALILFMLASVFFAACDTLESDAIENQPAVELSQDPIMMTPQSSGVIDLNSLITSSTGTHTFSITTQPKLGKLQSLGDNFVKYTPNEGVKKGRDGFVVSVFGNNNVVIGKDTIVIIIEPDSTQFPCGVYAWEDVVKDVTGPVIIDVLANDTACSVDSTQLQIELLEVFAQGGDVDMGPLYGTVKVVSNNRIEYTPNAQFTGYDHFFYQLKKPANVPQNGDPEQTSVAVVHVYGLAPCDSLVVLDDVFSIDLDSLVYDSIVHSDTLQYDTIRTYKSTYLHVTGNDSWCERIAYSAEIVEYPEGQIIPDATNSGFKYTPPIDALPGGVDRLRYRICSGQECREADVTLNFR